VIELNLCQHVVFQGRVPRSEIPAILVQNDVFLFPSVWEEPIARTVMEAMASGLPVIGTTSGGQREMLIDGVNALVFPPDDPIRLMECILQLRDDFDLRFRLGEAGRQVVQNRFSLERMTENIETWLASIVKEGSRDQTTNPR
jgi:glycosyltransferase involved in cell wall biosynthesis